MKKMIFETSEALISHLKQTDIRVPKRTQGRKTEHTEQWSTYRLLSSLYKSGQLKYPLAIVHRDKPDYHLKMQNDSIGIEFTEAIPEQYAWAMALREKYFSNSPLEPSMFRWGSPKRSKKEILRILKDSEKELIGLPWYGDSVEIEWAEGIQDCIISKTSKLNNKEFHRFKENWLLIYDNLPSAALNIDNAVDYLIKKEQDLSDNFSKNKHSFDKIFIEVSNFFLIKHSSIIEKLEIHDIWS